MRRTVSPAHMGFQKRSQSPRWTRHVQAIAALERCRCARRLKACRRQNEMSTTLQNCRYCRESFTPKPGKPGYVDECPECLHAKTHAEPPVDVVSRLMEHSPEARRALKALRRSFLSMGISESKVDDRIAWMLTTDFPDSSSGIAEIIKARRKLESETQI